MTGAPWGTDVQSVAPLPTRLESERIVNGLTLGLLVATLAALITAGAMTVVGRGSAKKVASHRIV